MRSRFPCNPLPESIPSIYSAFYCTRHLERNAELGISLHIFEQDFLAASIIKFDGPAVGMTGDSLVDLQSASVLQIVRKKGTRRPASPLQTARMSRAGVRQVFTFVFCGKAGHLRVLLLFGAPAPFFCFFRQILLGAADFRLSGNKFSYGWY